MEKDRKTRAIAAFAMIISLLGVGVAFASMSTTLNIRGTAMLEKGDSWDIHFSNLKNANLLGNTVEKKAPIINSDTYIGDFDLTFKSQNDGVEYSFDIVNDGDFDARVSSINFFNPSCTSISSSVSSNDLITVCNNIEYTLTDDSGKPIAVGDVILKKQKVSVKLKIRYTGSLIPTENITINDLGAMLLYSQN